MTNKRLGIATGVLLALDLALEWLTPTSALTDLVTIALVIVIMILGFRLTVNTIRAAIWRLRNRLLVTYLFIGVIPIVLILALAAVGTWIVSGQVAVYLVTSELERRAASLESHARYLSRAKSSAVRNAAAMQLAPLIEERLPGLEMLLIGDDQFHYRRRVRLRRPRAHGKVIPAMW